MDTVGLLARLGYGEVAGQMDELLRELVQEVERTGKGGALTLKLSVKPAKTFAESRRVELGVALNLVRPKREPEVAVMWVRDGELSPRDPRQPELPMRELMKSGATVIVGGEEIDPETGEITEESVG